MADKLPFEKIDRQILVKQQAATDPHLGQDINLRSVSELIEYGIVNVDKPKCPTSHDVTESVRKILRIKKAGHCGTLDPAVTGVLPIALGRATRIVQTLLGAGKEYLCKMNVHKPVEQQKLTEVFAEFTGIIEQVPPVRSAVKRQKRERQIYYIEILQVRKRVILFRVGCQAGTYIRKLVHDMGERLGVGAHMTGLRRTKAGCFDESSLCSLEDLTESYARWREQNDEQMIRRVIQPIENAVAHLPKVWIDDMAVEPICHGHTLFVPGIIKLHSDIKCDDMVAVMTLKDELVAIGQAKLTSEMIAGQEKGAAVDIKKVFMREKTYRRN